MLCDILKTFPFSRDGVDSHMAKAGEQVDIPDALVPGLQRDRYVKPVGEQGNELKSQPAASENKALGSAPENKDGDPVFDPRKDQTDGAGKESTDAAQATAASADEKSDDGEGAEETSAKDAEPVDQSADESTKDNAADSAAAAEDAAAAADEHETSSDEGEEVGVPDEGAAEDAAEPAQEEDRAALRAEYTEKFGTKPYNGWDAATLRQKIAEAK
ncbi:MAG: hypothetical protein GC208_09690 [Alphaproteobacteria bacterium]|nr:hypothetical protein [Alphaproteobacteria bacterium]